MALREINLIPVDVLQKKYLLRHLFFWTGCLMLCFFLIFGFYLYQVHVALAKERPETTLDDIHAKLGITLEEIKETQQEIQRLSYQEAFINTLSRTPPYSIIFMKLSEIMNKRTWLTKLIIRSNSEEELAPVISLCGISLSNEDLGSFLNRISGEPMFSNVILKYAEDSQISTSRQNQRVNAIEFEINCEISRL